MDIVYPHFLDEAYEVRHNANHRWFYKRNMGKEDAIVFKLHDTNDGEATGKPDAVLKRIKEAQRADGAKQCVRIPHLLIRVSPQAARRRGRVSRSRLSSSVDLPSA
jgi:hypothetical protein